MSAGKGLEPGEVVNVAIKGVRVDQQHPDGTVTIVAEHVDGMTAHWQMPPQAAVTRVAPAAWPPCKGDLWRDGYGALWLACEAPGFEVRMVCASAGETRPPEHLLGSGSVELVHYEIDRPPF